ncbi:zinc-binding alcohol dehydrogenase family protein [Luteolibacter pohnpeiensis]|uniref:Zinc-type alcohol dehydrogenase-like protein n=1 Tax=Luteolibacter pohnpeiensis TaxID=454153 RepID=A0A934VWM1_9BACT|nr:zinc-binding alcohol dehydrogenase family protein [Luteolibacter pohnpeiensis]MBK1882649.1 zinc-binding alcohol dehydrogenase family protein [Luteolibacter pohnpeiensis]
MKAIGATRFLPVSDPGCLVDFEAEKPIPGPKDLLVKIAAIAVNPVDTKIRASLGGEELPTPRILGWDASGIVEAVGSEVVGFSPGDEVMYAGDVTRAGCNAEFQAMDYRLVAHKPKSFSFADAAALPLVGVTAWELLLERMGVDPDGANRGSPLLVINGAGGVGSALIPLARAAGLKVIATASRQETSDWCLKLGADHIVNHREPLRPQIEALGITEFPWIANLYDTERYWDITADLIAPLGALGLIVEPKNPVNIGNPIRAKSPRIAWEFMFTRSKFQTADMHRQGEILQKIAARCDNGSFPKITTRVLQPICAQNLRLAHQAMEEHSAHGKWVLQNF